MREKFEDIRTILTELENEIGSPDDQAFIRNFDALEIPNLIISIVDYLQPILTTYEAALYWYCFRHSILTSGQQHLRVSVRGLCEGVVLSSSGQSRKLSYRAVQKTLQTLVDKKALLKSGETTREGTPYKICLPEEIPACRDKMHVASKKTKPVDVIKELDYYNVKENRLMIFERDNFICTYCKKQLTRFTATLDHVQPVSRGGDNSFDNLVTACLLCNSRRGNKPVMDIIDKVDDITP